jgi:hypothetical protein
MNEHAVPANHGHNAIFAATRRPLIGVPEAST